MDSSSINSYSANLSALQAFSQGVATTAHNIANTNTEGFEEWTYTYGPVDPSGVQINIEPGGTDEVYGFNPFGEGDVSLSPAQIPSYTLMLASPEGNTVDMPRQMVALTIDQRAFEANLAALASKMALDDSVQGLIIDQDI